MAATAVALGVGAWCGYSVFSHWQQRNHRMHLNRILEQRKAGHRISQEDFIATIQKISDINSVTDVSSIWSGMISNGYTAAVKTLIEHGANIEALDRNGRTPLHLAAQNNQMAIVQLLLDNGANYEATDNADTNPLAVALDNGYSEITALLLQPYNLNPENNTVLLMKMIRQGNVTRVQALIQQDFNINCKDHYGNMPLHAAITNGKINIAKLLVESGAKIDATNKDGNTPLTLALAWRHESIAKWIISRENFSIARNFPTLLKYGWATRSWNISKAASYRRSIPARAGKLVRQGGRAEDIEQLIKASIENPDCEDAIKCATRQSLLHAGFNPKELKEIMQDKDRGGEDPLTYDTFNPDLSKIVVLPTSPTHPRAYNISSIRDFHKYGNRNDPFNSKPIPAWFFRLLAN